MQGKNIINRRRVVLSISALLLLILTYIGFSYSYIEVIAENKSDGPIDYRLSAEKSDKIIEGTTSSDNFKILVPRDTYQIEINQDNANGFAVTPTKTFLQTQEVKIDLVAEGWRHFIANNPELCARLIDDTLISWSCGGDVSTLYKHSEPTNNNPPQKQRIDFDIPVFGDISGIVSLDGKEYLIVTTDLDGGVTVVAYPVDVVSQEITGQVKVLLTNEDTGSTAGYMARETSGGLLVFSVDGLDYFYYETLDRDGRQSIEIPESTIEQYNLHSISVHDNTILAVFGENSANEIGQPMYYPSLSEDEQEGGGDIDFDKTETLVGEMGSGAGIFYIIEGDEVTTYEFDFSITQARLCDERLLCVLNQKELTVYEISDNELSQVHSFANIKQFDSLDGTITVINDTGVLVFDDINFGEGRYRYTFGDYGYCGVVLSRDYLLVCVDDESATTPMRFLLLVDEVADNTNAIDKKMLALSRMHETKVVIPYKNSIYITPNIPIELDESTYQRVYNPEKLQDYRRRTQQKIEELRINTDSYTIYGPLFN